MRLRQALIQLIADTWNVLLSATRGKAHVSHTVLPEIPQGDSASAISLLSVAFRPANALLDEPMCEVLAPEFHDGFGTLVYQHCDTTTGKQPAVVQFLNSADNGRPIDGTAGVLDDDVAGYVISNAGPKRHVRQCAPRSRACRRYAGTR